MSCPTYGFTSSETLAERGIRGVIHLPGSPGSSLPSLCQEIATILAGPNGFMLLPGIRSPLRVVSPSFWRPWVLFSASRGGGIRQETKARARTKAKARAKADHIHCWILKYLQAVATEQRWVLCENPGTVGIIGVLTKAPRNLERVFNSGPISPFWRIAEAERRIVTISASLTNWTRRLRGISLHWNRSNPGTKISLLWGTREAGILLKYASNNVAGLPSPVPEERNGDEYEYDDFCLEFDDSVARNVKEIFEFVRDPYFVDTYITCSSSCSCRLSSSSVEINVNNKDVDDNGAIGYGEMDDVPIEGNDIKEVGILPFLAKSADLDMKMKQGYIEDWEESKPSLIRRRKVVNSQAEVKTSEPMVSESRSRVHSSEIISLNDQKPSISGKRVDSGVAKVQSPWKGNANSQPSEIPTRKTVTERKLSPVKAKHNVGSVSDSSKSDIGSAMSKGRTELSHRSTGQKIRKTKVNSPRPRARVPKPNGSGPSKAKIAREQSGDLLKDVHHKISADDSQSKSRSSSIAAAVPESYAVVKCSYDPQKDFRDSMVEMIVENDLRYSEDLQQLLGCYLSLNSDEYHDVIVQVFEQVRSDLANISV